MFLPLIPLLALIAQLASAVSAAATPQRRVSIPTPPNDPFYEPPRGWESANNGDILRTRKIETGLIGVDKMNVKEAYQILYRTTGTYATNASTTVTTVIVPHNAQPNKLVNYVAFTDANGPQCAPSYTIRMGGNFANDISMTYQQLVYTTFLNDGYIVTVPDHQGPTRAFGAGPLEGRMSLDGIRATLNFKPLGLKKNAKVATYGYSGGSIASGWAAELQPTYAPEINAVGFALGGIVANISSTVENINGGMYSAFAFAGFAGLYYAYKGFQDWITPKLTDEAHTALESARRTCLVQNLLKYPFQNLLSDKYVQGGSTLLHEPVFVEVLDQLVMGTNKSQTPKAPVYMFHGHHDEIIPFPSALKSGKAWAHQGANIFFQEYTDLLMGHITTAFLTIPDVLFFVRDRMQDKPFVKGWNHKLSDNPLKHPNAPLKGLEVLVKDIQDIVGKQVGPADSIMKEKIKKHA